MVLLSSVPHTNDTALLEMVSVCLLLHQSKAVFKWIQRQYSICLTIWVLRMCAFVSLFICYWLSLLCIIYRKTSNTSRVSNRNRVSNTSRGFWVACFNRSWVSNTSRVFNTSRVTPWCHLVIPCGAAVSDAVSCATISWHQHQHIPAALRPRNVCRWNWWEWGREQRSACCSWWWQWHWLIPYVLYISGLDTRSLCGLLFG